MNEFRGLPLDGHPGVGTVSAFFRYPSGLPLWLFTLFFKFG